jgi:hypothetical protein
MIAPAKSETPGHLIQRALNIILESLIVETREKGAEQHHGKLGKTAFVRRALQSM